MKSFYTLLLLACLSFSSCNKQKETKIEVTTLAKTTKSWDGTPLPKYLEGDPEVTILKITIPPKTKLHMHKHLVINAGMLLKGQLTVVSKEKDTLHLKAGDPIVELVNKWHYGKNEGDNPVEIIVFYAGNEGIPITVLEEGNTEKTHY